MKIFFIVIFLFFSQSIFAQTEVDKILVAPSQEDLSDDEVEKNIVEDTKEADEKVLKVKNDEKEIIPRDYILNLKFFAGPDIQSYKLDGTGFKGKLKAKVGYNIGIQNTLYDNSGLHGLSLGFITSGANFNSPVVLTPRTLKVERNFYQTSYIYNGFYDKALGSVIGYGYIKQKSTKTSPNSLVSAYSLHGPTLGIIYSKEIVDFNFKIDVSTLFLIPITLKENDKKTGDLKSGFSNISSLFLSKKISESLTCAFGARVNYESLNFSGSGNRGTTNGQIKFNSISFPIEMRWQL